MSAEETRDEETGASPSGSGTERVATRAYEAATRPPTLGERLLYRFVRWAVAWFSRVFWRLEIHGLEHVPEGPFVLAPVHRSNIDSLVVAAITRRRMRYFGKHTMWKYRWAGRFFDAMGGIPIHRGTPDREAMRALQQVLEAGDPAVVFPEGQRRTGPVIEDVFDGPAFIAGRTGAPILPVGIGGSEGAMPPGSGRIHPVKVVIVIGEAIPAPQGEDGKRPSRRMVREATEHLKETVQALFDRAQELAGTP